jgi:hypothetical protein
MTEFDMLNSSFANKNENFEAANLRKQIDQLKSNNKKLESERGNDELFRKKLSWWLAKLVSLLALFYLVWGVVAPSNLKPKEITNQDIALAFVILLFNSGLLDKLTGFSVSSSGIEAKFEELEEEIDQNKQNIYELQQKQIDDLLSFQNLLYRAVLDGYEYLTLHNLNIGNVTSIPPYHYSALGESQLRRLYSIGFIELKAGQSFQGLEANQYIPFQALKDRFVITDYGKQYLSQMDKMKLEPQIAD